MRRGPSWIDLFSLATVALVAVGIAGIAARKAPETTADDDLWHAVPSPTSRTTGQCGYFWSNPQAVIYFTGRTGGESAVASSAR
jgi:hypothetical protein